MDTHPGDDQAEGLQPSTGRDPGRFFLSYSRDNLQLASSLQRDLQAHGVPCWMDRSHITATEADWYAHVQRGIRECSEVIWLVSPESVLSDEVRKELQIAEKCHKPIRRLCLVPIDSVDLPDHVRRAQLSDWSCRHASYQDQMLELLHELTGSRPPRFDPLGHLATSSAEDLHQHLRDSAHCQPVTAGIRPMLKYWIDVTPYTSTSLLLPTDFPSRPLPRELAILLRFSGSCDRDTATDILLHRMASGLSPWLLMVEGLKTKDQHTYHLPLDAAHVWNDAVLSVRRLLNLSSVKRQSVHLYMDAPAILGMRIGLELDRGRHLEFFQYDRTDNRYHPINFFRH